jgi:hypothetical protein
MVIQAGNTPYWNTSEQSLFNCFAQVNPAKHPSGLRNMSCGSSSSDVAGKARGNAPTRLAFDGNHSAEALSHQ